MRALERLVGRALIGAALLASGRAVAEPAAPSSATGAPGVVAPKLESDPAVPYPEGATGDASVTLLLTVGADGAVDAVAVAKGEEPFAAVALTVARTFRFAPATRNGVPIAAKVRYEVVFKAPVRAPTAGSDQATSLAPSVAEPSPPPRRVLPPPDYKFEEVRVSGNRGEPSRTATLSRAEVREIPGAFGDPFRAIEIMPGVTPIVSGLPFFFIRGAPPGNVGYYLDGVRVPLLFHVGAGPSVIHPGLVERVDLYPGGYPARFGRFTGGIVSGETRAPADKPRGEANLRLFDVGALVETPFASGKGDVLVGGRYSYTALLLSKLSPDITLDYWDYQARVGYNLTPKDRISVFSFGAYDYLGQRTPTETLTLFGTEFHRIDFRYDHRLDADGSLRLAVTLGADRSRLQQDRIARDRMIGSRVEVVQRLSENALFRGGADVQVDTFDVDGGTRDLAGGENGVASFFPSRNDIALGARADVVLDVTNRFQITPGLRADVFGSQGNAAAAVDPRFSMRTVLSDKVRLLSAFGLAHQPPAFVVPVPGFQPGGLRGGLQRSVQESVGVEWDLMTATTATLTLFHNGFFDMSDPLGTDQPNINSVCRPNQALPWNAIGSDRGGQPGGAPLRCTPRLNPGVIGEDRAGGAGEGAESRGDQEAARALEVRTRGSAYGLELFLKRRLTSRLGGFLSYTLSRSTRAYGRQSFVATFDRTHVANAALAYDLGRFWRAGSRVVFYTGLPQGLDPANTGETRLPSFFRLDLRLEKRWNLGPTTWLAVVAEWMNATLNKESVSTQCTLQGCVAQTIGPVTIPSLGLEGAF